MPDQINQIICLFQMFAVHLELILCFKDLFVIEITFKGPHKYELSTWQPERENSFLYKSVAPKSTSHSFKLPGVFVISMNCFSKNVLKVVKIKA